MIARPHALAAIIHRLSGLALALFLPVHFWALGRGLEGATRLDAFLDWTRQPLVQFAEFGLVLLLATHLAGGLRVLAIEFLPWHQRQKTSLALAGGASLAIGLAFLLMR